MSGETNGAGTNIRKLLVVEDDPGLQAQLKWAYEDYRVLVAGDHDAAIELLRAEEPDVVTLDLGLPPDPDGTREGFRTLKAILEIKPDTKVIVVSGHGERASALTAIANGAWDFYQKPIDIDELGLIVCPCLPCARARGRERAAGGARRGRQSRSRRDDYRRARNAEGRADDRARREPRRVSVMLLGASGTGKELLARGLHEASARRDGAFVAINCAAIPENLLESELFGHEKGAFTGAVKTTEGKIELAHGGTLFLDEVGDIPLPLQVKLLRFLQERTIERIGGRKAIAVDTRIVCATHRDLDAMIAGQSFRDDLYYRLAEMVVKIPSLAERPGDAVLLARHFLHQYAPEMNPAVRGFAPDALQAIDGGRWPGNVRELENRIKRAVIMADGKLVMREDLDMAGKDAESEEAWLNLRSAREAADRVAIRRAMTQSEGNISAAAKLLGISRPTLYDLLKQYRMQA